MLPLTRKLINTKLNNKRRKIGLLLTGLGILIWLVFAIKDHHTTPQFPPMPKEYLCYAQEHARDESSDLFYRNASNMQGKIINAEQPVNVEEVFDSAVAALDNAPLKYAQMVKKNYKLLLGGEDKIAGKDAYTLSLLSKQRNFPWKQLWIDKKTFVVLAMKNWSSQNKIKPTSSVDMPIKFEYRELDKKVICTIERKHIYVPKGFLLSGFKASALDWHCSFSDGLNSVSIFVTFSSKPHKSEVFDAGQALICSQFSGRKEIIVVADLPVKELSKIADSIK